MQCTFLFSSIFLSFSLFQASEEESGKPFQCPICGLVIKRKSYWKRHMVIHTGLKSHQCPLCPFRCARKDNLKSHMKVSHLRMGLTERQAQPELLHTGRCRRHLGRRGAASGADGMQLLVVVRSRTAPMKHVAKGLLCNVISILFTTQNLKAKRSFGIQTIDVT